MDNGGNKIVKTKQKLYKQWAKTESAKKPKGGVHLREKYNKYRRSLKHAITAAKSKFYYINYKQITSYLTDRNNIVYSIHTVYINVKYKF